MTEIGVQLPIFAEVFAPNEEAAKAIAEREYPKAQVITITNLTD